MLIMLSGGAAKSHANGFECADDPGLSKCAATGIHPPGNVDGLSGHIHSVVKAMILQLQVGRDKIHSIATFINQVAIEMHRVGIDHSLAGSGIAAAENHLILPNGV